MRYGSVCSGVEAATLAWEVMGWEPVFFAEVEPFPAAVLMQRFNASAPVHMPDPDEAGISAECRDDRLANLKTVRNLAQEQEKADGRNGHNGRNGQQPGNLERKRVPNLGDMTKIEGKKYNGTVELLVGGTPCQGFSIAGKRKGLDDKRSQLSLKYCELAYECGARWLVWENVPGVFSSESGKDFACFLGKLCGWEVEVPEDGWRNSGIISCAAGCFGLAWRVFDAQYVRVDGLERAVPQRRRRVFVVGYLGDWKRAAAVLFDGDSLSWGFAPERKAGKAVAKNFGRSTAAGGGLGADFQIESTLPAVAGTLGSRATAGGGFGTDFDLAGGIVEAGADAQEKGKRKEEGLGTDGTDGNTGISNVQVEQPEQERARGPEFIAPVAGTLTNAGKAAGSATRQDAEAGLLICMATGQGNAETATATTLNCNSEAPILFKIGGHGQARTDMDVICASESGPGFWKQGDVGGTVKVNMAEPTTIVVENSNGQEVAHTLRGEGFDTSEDGSGRGVPIIAAHETGPGWWKKDDIAGTLRAEGENRPSRPSNIICYDGRQITSPQNKSNPLSADTHAPVIAFMAGAGSKAGSTGATENLAPTLKSSASGSNRSPAIAENHGHNGRNGHNGQESGSTVRRLTPLECERLMGFFDWHTLIRWKVPKHPWMRIIRKPELLENYHYLRAHGFAHEDAVELAFCPDGPRYKACGNSMPVNSMRWIGQRIEMVERQTATDTTD